MAHEKTVLVFGGSGFIGRNLIAALAEKPGTRVISISNFGSSVPQAEKSIRLSMLESLDVDGQDTIVFHVAAHRYDSKNFLSGQSEILEKNTSTTARIFHFCAERKISEIRMASSVAVYPAGSEMDDTISIDLNREPNPGEAFYAWSKRYGEVLAKLYSERYGIHTLSFRLSNPYGPHDSTNLERAHVAPAFVMKALADSSDFEIKGDPEVERDFIFVQDVTDIFIRSMAVQGKTDSYNLCTGQSTKLRKLAQICIEASGKQKTILPKGAGTNPVKSRMTNPRKLMRDFQWEKFTPLESGIRSTMEWYSNALKP